MDKEKLNEQIENQINKILEQGITIDNITIVGKLIDIHKDLKNEEYWEKKEEVMKNELQNEKIRR